MPSFTLRAIRWYSPGSDSPRHVPSSPRGTSNRGEPAARAATPPDVRGRAAPLAPAPLGGARGVIPRSPPLVAGRLTLCGAAPRAGISARAREGLRRRTLGSGASCRAHAQRASHGAPP